MYRRLKYWLANRVWQARLRATRRLLAPGPRTWEVLDRLGVPGFGIDLIRVDFPPDLNLADGWNAAAEELAAIFNREQAQHLAFLDACLTTASELETWPVAANPDRPALPWRRNEFLTYADMAILHGALRHLRPERYVEIGSGISTRVAAAARASGGFTMPIIAIDPEPRVEVTALCERVHRLRVEAAVDETLAAITSRSVLFFDGSHRCFPGSDVTVFFLSLLPRLPAGVVVHIHDIYLPGDYPGAMRNRYWSEQYMLAAWLLGGSRRLKVRLPAAQLSSQSPGRELLASCLPRHEFDPHVPGPASSSFWFEVT